jgi:hypothetical protein
MRPWPEEQAQIGFGQLRLWIGEREGACGCGPTRMSGSVRCSLQSLGSLFVQMLFVITLPARDQHGQKVLI